jgi:hypothetical protein
LLLFGIGSCAVDAVVRISVNEDDDVILVGLVVVVVDVAAVDVVFAYPNVFLSVINNLRCMRT